MSETVIAHVANKLAVRTHEAEALLRAYAERLRARIAESGHAKIHGLGTFELAAAGITFKPDTELLEAAWVTLESLEPVVVLSAEEAPPPPAETDPGQDIPEVEEIQPVQEEETVDVVVDAPPGEADSVEVEADAATDSEEEASLNGESTARVPVDDGPVRPVHLPPSRNGERRMRWAIPILGGVAVVAVLLVLFQPWSSSDSPPTGEPSDEVGLVDSAPDPPAPDTETPIPDTDTATPVTETTAPDTETTAPDTETTALDTEIPTPVTETPPPAIDRGFDWDAGGYTLVVASVGTEADAERERDRLLQAISDVNVPIDIMVDGARYRVAVGQYPTAGDAVESKTFIPGIPGDAWALRIRGPQ